MRIAIIGAGKVGGALANGLARKGHAVTLGVRDAAKPEVQALSRSTGAALESPSAAAASADIVILSLPWNGAESAIRSLGDLRGKIVVDCMNPLTMKDGALGLERGFTTSGAEAVQAWLPEARIVKTLNQVGAELMADNATLPQRPVMFMAGDDEAAKDTVAGLLTDLGFEPQNAGDLSKARILEPYAMVWINQALLRGAGRDWAFGMVRRAQS